MKNKRLISGMTIVSVGLLATSCSFSISLGSKTSNPSDASSSILESSFTSEESSSLLTSIQASSSESVDSFASSQPVAKTKMNYTFKDYGAHNIAKNDFCPNSGSPKLLVIPVWFTDSGSYIDASHKNDVRSDIEAAYFGTEEETGWQSVKSYYKTLSQNRCDINGVVTNWFECGDSSDTAGNFATESARSLYMNNLINRAVDWYFAQENADERSTFDIDKNGHLDGVMLIYGAPDRSNRGYYNKDNLWAYCSWLKNDPNEEEATANVIFWASYDFMYGSNTATARSGHNYSGGDTLACTIDAHTFIHEMGHVFGVSDYYDYSQRYNPAGGFSMQDMNVGSHDPYSAMACGWVDPYIPKESCEITIRPFQSEGRDCILLSPFWDSMNSPFDEYLLLELYTPTGLNEYDTTNRYKYYYPTGPQEAGIRLWHIDSRLVKPKNVAVTGQIFWDARNLTIDPTIDNCYQAISNSYYSTESEGYCSVLGSSYYNYNLLQLIKNSPTATHQSTYYDYLEGEDLFKDGSIFTMNLFKKQFVNGSAVAGPELNNGDFLGWSFEVAINGTGNDVTATISLTKN